MKMNHDEITVHYPTWTKVIGIIGLPVLSLASIWMVLMPLLEADLSTAQNVLMPLLGFLVLYQCTIGFRCLRYLNTVFILHDEGIDVHHQGQVSTFDWRDLAINHYAFATVTQIKRKNGDTLAYFSDSLPNLSLLTQTIENGLD